MIVTHPGNDLTRFSVAFPTLETAPRFHNDVQLASNWGIAMELQYELREGAYHLYDMSTPPSKATGERRLRLRTDDVAIAFDARTGVLHEHGSPMRIQSWALNTRRRLRSSGELAQANDIVVVSGPLPVDEINKCLRIQGYCRRMFSQLATMPHGKRLAHRH
jgi:hypothetical protein